MHSSNHGKTSFVYNGDYSGNIEIVPDDTNENTTSVPMADLIAFVAEYVRNRQQIAIEKASDDEVLGLK